MKRTPILLSFEIVVWRSNLLRRELPDFARAKVRVHGSRATKLATVVSDANLTILVEQLPEHEDFLKAKVCPEKYTIQVEDLCV